MRQVTPQAQVAKAIRKILKASFPKTKFSVTSTSYAGGDSVRVSWIEGPITSDVRKGIEHFEAGKFNGMNDSYEYKDSVNHPTTKYLFTDREILEETFQLAFDETKDYFGEFEGAKTLDESFKVGSRFGYARDTLSRYIGSIDLTDQRPTLKNISEVVNHS